VSEHSGHGYVERGFYDLYCSMQYECLPVVAGIQRALPIGSTCWVFGHSLGAALGTYLLTDMAASKLPQDTIKAMLFASPKTGDARYVEYSNETVGFDNYQVFNYSRDMVPDMPPLPIYKALANRILITPDTAQAKIPKDIFSNHHATSYAAMLGAPLGFN